ncbi:phosphoribosylglycinamide formyltransferase [Candidatus Peregrinibacteria bacterium]|nr:phosphoribosylglycinamide formyltransferase [Candidatus Peregrinibacteria bacterium]MBT7009624.1 phosphoribosylglycinamide formyltransferase [Candidatus Peregrinibacteria bacterium]MBT7344467.1 phosphoribosylglycinamide formyltransferase [Candidatus Peregrinibacteria bacterium]
MQFVILSSSRGTTMQSVLDSLKDGSLQAHCCGLVTDKANRGCVQKAKDAGLPIRVVEKQTAESRENYDKRLNVIIKDLVGEDATYIACMGWMFIFSEWFVSQWKDKILNVHPALLPKFPGAHAITDALSSEETETGMTIHLIDEGVDTGPIILQKPCSIKPDDTEETLKLRVQKLEKEWYPKVLQKIHEEV